MIRVLAFVDILARVLRAMLGVPDYGKYVERCRQRHPATQPMTRDQFTIDFLERKFSRPGSRCC